MNDNKIIDIFKETLIDTKDICYVIDWYKENFDKKYLVFIENIAIQAIGEEIWIEYIAKRLEQIKDIYEFKGKKLSPNIVSILIFNRSSHNGKWKLQYPKLYSILQQGLLRFQQRNDLNKEYNNNLDELLKKYEGYSDMEIIQDIEQYLTRSFYDKQIKATKVAIYQRLLKTNKLIRFAGIEPKIKQSKIGTLIDETVDKYLSNQESVLLNTNITTIRSSKNNWTLFYRSGVSLHWYKFDFSMLNSNQLRSEIKEFLRYIYSMNNIESMANKYLGIKQMLEVLEREFNIKKMADIKVNHVGYVVQYFQSKKVITPRTLSSYRTAMAEVSDFLINKDNYNDRPKYNVWRKLNFYNVSSISKKTSYIPDEVLKQIIEHSNELSEQFALAFKLFIMTGMRAKEVFQLEYPCCNYGEAKENYVPLNYIPYKIRLANRRKGKTESNYVYIEKLLAEEIENYASQHGVNAIKNEPSYLFINERKGRRALSTVDGFVTAINRIITKYDIKDNTGEIWRFTSRQTRKTLAVNLIEAGATSQIVAQQLGHISTKTTNMYYAEVKLRKLAEMDSEFFRKKFELQVGNDNLSLYSETERKQLYIDFCNNAREVEYGQCVKHYSEGPCGKRTGRLLCATCDKLCTGLKYKEKWEELIEKQQKTIEELIEYYESKDIDIYTDFVEYKRELKLLEKYIAVLENIMKGSI